MRNDDFFEELSLYDGCAVCGNYKGEDNSRGRIDASRMIARLDACFEENDLAEAERVLEYWRAEARSLGDMRGELAVVSEALGLYRKTGNRDKALAAVGDALALIEALDNKSTVSAATVLLNAATTLKAFGKAEEALPHYEDALGVYRESLPADDPRLGGFYNNYGLALADLGRKNEAEAAYQNALDIMEGKGKGLLEAAVTYLNLAHLYELWQDEKIYPALCAAYGLLCAPSIKHDGYFRFTLSKCIPSFHHFGLFEEEAALRAMMGKEA